MSELSQEEEMELVTQVKKLEDTNNLSSSSLDDLAISQIAENMEKRTFCLSRNGVLMCDEKFDLNEVDHSRFVKPVSDEELKSLVENQENVNTKNNTLTL